MGDCAINISYEDSVDKEGNVTLSAAQKLAEVAIETAKTAKVFGIDPKVAMLSFSTKGSGKGGTVKLSHDATAIAKEMDPELKIDGEMQFDAAVAPEVGQLKFPGSPGCRLTPTPSSSPASRRATSATRSPSVWAASRPTAPSCRV